MIQLTIQAITGTTIAATKFGVVEASAQFAVRVSSKRINKRINHIHINVQFGPPNPSLQMQVPYEQYPLVPQLTPAQEGHPVGVGEEIPGQLYLALGTNMSLPNPAGEK